MAHLLEHMDFIETTNGRQIKNETRRPRRQLERHDVRRPHQLLRDVHRDRREPEVGARPRGRPHGEREVHQGDPRHRDDRRPQRVRARREQPGVDPRASASPPPRTSGTTTASRPSDRRTTSRKCRSNRLAAFYKKYYQPDNAVLVITGRIDEAKTLQMVADSMGKLPRPTRVLDQTYTVEPPQDGERFVALRRVGQGQNVIVAYHAVAAGHPGCGGAAGAGRRDERRRRRPRRPRRRRRRQDGRLAKALVDTEARASRPAWASSSCTIPACDGVGHAEQGSVARRGARRHLQGARGHRQESADARTKSIACEASCCAASRTACRTRSRSRPARSNTRDRAGRLAADVPAARSAAGRHAGRSRARREGLLQAVEPDRRLLHSRHGAGSHGGAGSAGPGGDAPELQEHGDRRRAARRSTRRSPTSRAASCARSCPTA